MLSFWFRFSVHCGLRYLTPPPSVQIQDSLSMWNSPTSPSLRTELSFTGQSPPAVCQKHRNLSGKVHELFDCRNNAPRLFIFCHLRLSSNLPEWRETQRYSYIILSPCWMLLLLCLCSKHHPISHTHAGRHKEYIFKPSEIHHGLSGITILSPYASQCTESEARGLIFRHLRFCLRLNRTVV